MYCHHPSSWIFPIPDFKLKGTPNTIDLRSYSAGRVQDGPPTSYNSYKSRGMALINLRTGIVTPRSGVMGPYLQVVARGHFVRAYRSWPKQISEVLGINRFGISRMRTSALMPLGSALRSGGATPRGSTRDRRNPPWQGSNLMHLFFRIPLSALSRPSLLKRWHPQNGKYSSNYQFSGSMLVSGRVQIV